MCLESIGMELNTEQKHEDSKSDEISQIKLTTWVGNVHALVERARVRRRILQTRKP